MTEINNSEIDIEESHYNRCWACGTLCLDNIKHYKRIEKHHLLGKNNNKIFDLCLLCHDFVDRMPLNDIKVFSEFLINLIEECERLPKKDYKFLRLLFIKVSKMIYEQEYQVNDKQKDSEMISKEPIKESLC